MKKKCFLLQLRNNNDDIDAYAAKHELALAEISAWRTPQFPLSVNSSCLRDHIKMSTHCTSDMTHDTISLLCQRWNIDMKRI